jgi:hypothetical protein
LGDDPLSHERATPRAARGIAANGEARWISPRSVRYRENKGSNPPTNVAGMRHSVLDTNTRRPIAFSGLLFAAEGQIPNIDFFCA